MRVCVQLAAPADWEHDTHGALPSLSAVKKLHLAERLVSERTAQHTTSVFVLTRACVAVATAGGEAARGAWRLSNPNPNPTLALTLSFKVGEPRMLAHPTPTLAPLQVDELRRAAVANGGPSAKAATADDGAAAGVVDLQAAALASMHPAVARVLQQVTQPRPCVCAHARHIGRSPLHEL